jgi:hypothetical protein
MTAHGSGPAARAPRPAHPGPDRRATEQLLRRDPAARRNSPQLAALLDAAAAPGRPGELAGRSAALAAFRDGRRLPVAIPGHRRRSARSRLARLLTLKVAVGLAVASGSVALAAATGALPGTPYQAGPPAGPKAPAIIASPNGNKDAATRATRASAAPSSAEKSCTANTAGFETLKPPAGAVGDQPAPPPPTDQPEIKSGGCVRVSPTASPSALPSFPPQGDQLPPGGSAPSAGQCHDACPPPGGDRHGAGYPPPPSVPAG